MVVCKLSSCRRRCGWLDNYKSWLLASFPFRITYPARHHSFFSCPGLNNVIREITNTLHQLYGIAGTVYGIQGGYRGFYDETLPTIQLTPSLVENIHHVGGTVLGSSRGGFDLDKILDFLHQKKINQ